MSIRVQFDKLMCKWVDGADNGWIEDKHSQTHFQRHPGVRALTDGWLDGQIADENFSPHCVHMACSSATLKLDHLDPYLLRLFQKKKKVPLSQKWSFTL